MTLEKWAALAEIVGAIAIVFSLLFVGYEVRQNNQRQIQSTTQAITSEYSSTMALLAKDEGLTCIYIRGSQNYLGLSGVDRVRFSSLSMSTFRLSEDMYFQQRAGSIDPRIWSGIEAMTREKMQLPGTQQWLEQRGHWFSDEFQQYLRSLISSSSKEPQAWNDPQCHTQPGNE